MRNMTSRKYAFLVLLLTFFGLTGNLLAAPDVTSPAAITMKSPSTFVVNEREVAATDLIKALKKSKIPTDLPLVVEVPANTSMNVIKDLTQRLATAGFKPFFKYPRHADATVKDPNAPAASADITPKKQRWRK
ncbi:MAG: hypothetical protein WCI95_04175 [bacterium]